MPKVGKGKNMKEFAYTPEGYKAAAKAKRDMKMNKKEKK